MLKKKFQDKWPEAGCDEAGRGCLAGPVVAAAVILGKKFRNAELNDSKKLSEKKRAELAEIIKNEALAWAIAKVDCHEIDQINILNASFLAMHRALDQLKTRPEHIIVDGNRFNPYPNVSHTTIIKGDAKFLSIAAASVLAKTWRDQYMEEQHLTYPQYLWSKNKGYPTKEHRDAIRTHGSTALHRKSFRLLPEQLEIKFN